MGPIPDAHLSRLHVTDVVHGSFGFHFQERPEQESLEETPLFEATEEAAHLIDAAGKDDEVFVDVVESLNPRVHDAVRTFFTGGGGHRRRTRGGGPPRGYRIRR